MKRAYSKGTGDKRTEKPEGDAISHVEIVDSTPEVFKPHPFFNMPVFAHWRTHMAFPHCARQERVLSALSMAVLVRLHVTIAA